MQTVRPLNLMDVDNLVREFIKEREQGIATLHRVHYKNGNQVSLRALKEELVEELRTGCVTFLNKDSPIEELNNYLFYIVNAYCKKMALPVIKQKAEYICPGCAFLSKEHIELNYNKVLRCEECAYELKVCQDPQRLYFFNTFAIHNKHGYHCPDCQRFIPHPSDNS